MENNLNQQAPNMENQPINNQMATQPGNRGFEAVMQKIMQSNLIQKIKNNPFISNMNPQNKKMLKSAFIGLSIFFVLLIIIGTIFSSLKNRPKKVLPTSTPMATGVEISLEEEIRNPSHYATDAGVLKIEEDVKKLDKDLIKTDLKNSSLWPPDIKFDVKFE